MPTLPGTILSALAVVAPCLASEPAPSEPRAFQAQVGGSGTSRFLALSDIHLDSSHASTPWYGSNSETSRNLWASTRAELRELLGTGDLDFVIYLGDMPGHGLSQSARWQQFGSVLSGLRESVTHPTNPKLNVPLLFLPGNNDSIVYDYGSWTNIDPTTKVAQTPFDADVGHVGDWPVIHGDVTPASRQVPSGAAHPPLYFGYYSAMPLGTGRGALRVITLNTVIFKRPGHYLYYRPTDGVSQAVAAQQQYDFLRSQLDVAASSAQDNRVLLAMHVPPGLDGYGGNPLWDPNLAVTDASGQKLSIKDAFLDLLAKHQGRIVGVLSGHTHLDGLRLYRDCNGDATELDISVPGVTTDHGNNPGLKVFTYRTADYELLDFETRYALKCDERSMPNWSRPQSYTFSEAYGGDGQVPMFDVLRQRSAATIFPDMKDVLWVLEPHCGDRNYQAAIDVKPDPQSCP